MKYTLFIFSGLQVFQAVTREVQADIPSISAEHTIGIEPKHVFSIGTVVTSINMNGLTNLSVE